VASTCGSRRKCSTCAGRWAPEFSFQCSEGEMSMRQEDGEEDRKDRKHSPYWVFAIGGTYSVLAYSHMRAGIS
jgi:hypothetical protein